MGLTGASLVTVWEEWPTQVYFQQKPFQPAKKKPNLVKYDWSYILQLVLCGFFSMCYPSTPIGDLDDWDMPEHAVSFRKSGSTFNKGIKR